MKLSIRQDNPRYVASILLYKTDGAKLIGDKIDMGWGTGISRGIYIDLFRCRGRIINRKRPLHNKRLSAKVKNGRKNK